MSLGQYQLSPGVFYAQPKAFTEEESLHRVSFMSSGSNIVWYKIPVDSIQNIIGLWSVLILVGEEVPS